jgi:hypothetical protein
MKRVTRIPAGTAGPTPVCRIVSGGQTGVDRAALDVAIELGLEHGGWCPKGRRAEDGRIERCYRLKETDSTEYAVRTEKNVLDSDGTLIICLGEPSGGTVLTRRLAERHGKPVLVVSPGNRQARRVREWLVEHTIRTLNVAGPRESTLPGIGESARRFLLGIFTEDVSTQRHKGTKKKRT